MACSLPCGLHTLCHIADDLCGSFACGADLCRSLAVDILATAFFSVNCCRFLLPALPTSWFMGASYRLKKSDKQSNYINLILSLYWKIRMFAWPINLWPLALEADMTSIDQLLELQRSHVHFNCLERIGNCHSMPCVEHKFKTSSLWHLYNHSEIVLLHPQYWLIHLTTPLQ